VKPGDDCWAYANGAWDARTQIAADPASAGDAVNVKEQQDHCFGNVKAMISSLVTCDPVSPPPVLTTATNCRPLAPR
jgi:predicted metalloendopeptidase